MRVVQINTFSNKSTGSIMMNIHNFLLQNGIDSYVVWGRGKNSNNDHEIFLNSRFGVYIHGFLTRLTDKTGFFSKKSTKKLLKKLDEIKPDIMHLHNIHGYFINIEILFNYIKKNNIKVIWTLHDCWAFTGHCSHFEYVNCEKWKTQCENCPLINKYPKSYTDNSFWNYQKKKKLFSNLDLTIVTPSKWLKNLVEKSFLKDYNVQIIPNGIDTNLFKPINGEFRKKYNLKDKKIILGVASEWTKEKGYDDFIKLSKILDDEYKIVLVGLSDKQLKRISDNIIGITRTENVEELVEIYSDADIYFNPTYADNFPTTNLEALACGTPVVTYNTGGSPECLNGKNGLVIEQDDYRKLISILNKDFNVNIDEIKKYFDKSKMLKRYLEIYNTKVGE